MSTQNLDKLDPASCLKWGWIYEPSRAGKQCETVCSADPSTAQLGSMKQPPVSVHKALPVTIYTHLTHFNVQSVQPSSLRVTQHFNISSYLALCDAPFAEYHLLNFKHFSK